MKANKILGSVGLLFSGVYLIAAILMPRPGLSDSIGPRAFPLLAGGMGIIVSLLLLTRHLSRKNLKDIVVSVHREHVRHIFLIVVICAVYGLIFESLGFLISSLLFLFAILTVINKNRWVQNLVIAVIFSTLFYFVFYSLLGLSLPRGLLAF